jgi:hypothetical protein
MTGSIGQSSPIFVLCAVLPRAILQHGVTGALTGDSSDTQHPSRAPLAATWGGGSAANLCSSVCMRECGVRSCANHRPRLRARQKVPWNDRAGLEQLFGRFGRPSLRLIWRSESIAANEPHSSTSTANARSVRVACRRSSMRLCLSTNKQAYCPASNSHKRCFI